MFRLEIHRREFQKATKYCFYSLILTYIIKLSSVMRESFWYPKFIFPFTVQCSSLPINNLLHFSLTTMMFKLRYSRKASILEWDSDSFTDCLPCEADAIEEEIIELVQKLKVGPKWWPGMESCSLEEANGEARRVCESKLLAALDGFPNLPHASTQWNGYKYKRSNTGLSLEDWGDEEVTDANRTENKDGTVSYEAHAIHFADPYGGLCNVVKLVIKVEVIPADIASK